MMSQFHMICIYEAISQWYGHVCNWINLGLKFYIAINHNPDNGAEIQDIDCGVSGIIIIFKMVKVVQYYGENDGGDGFINGTKVLLNSVKQWYNTNQLVSEDSYFYSISTK